MVHSRCSSARRPRAPPQGARAVWVVLRYASEWSVVSLRVLNTCLYQGFRADLADREEAEIR